jgi:DNA-binding MarR family transcriptional regulator
MSQLAHFEEVSRPAITKTVAQLEGLGLVIRVRDAEDGRASLISPTSAGERLFHEGHVRRTAPLATGIGKLAASDRDTLVSAVRLVELLSEAIVRLGPDD